MKSRLKSIPLPQKSIEKYCIFPRYDSDYITKQIYQYKKKEYREISTEPYDLASLFREKNKKLRKKVHVEVCCGTGDFITSIAAADPSISFIGVDYAMPAILRAVKKSDALGIENILFYTGRAEDFFLHDLKNTKFDRIYINYPDPWPKKRHKRRRLIDHDFIANLLPCMKKGGMLSIASDSGEYVRDMILCIADFKSLTSEHSQKNLTKPLLTEYIQYISNYSEKASKSAKFTYYLLYKLK
ncbi:tRNA (guanine(46)-N(7))-methyltransferase TrmB [Spirochaetota bacterium]